MSAPLAGQQHIGGESQALLAIAGAAASPQRAPEEAAWMAPRGWARAWPLLACLGALAIALRGGLGAGGAAAAQAAAPHGLVALSQAGAAHQPRFARVGGDIETIWQLPAGEEVKGIFFMAHGCQHQAPDFWSEIGADGKEREECRSTYFGRCLGLPEEALVRDAALARGYLAMAVSGGSGKKSCWLSSDVERVVAAVEHVRAEEKLPEDLPVLAMGASSGGAFLGMLTQGEPPVLQNVKCVVPQISPLNVYNKWDNGIDVLFVHMPKDFETQDMIFDDMDALKFGIEGAHRVDELKVEEKPITAKTFEPCLDSDLAAAVAKALKKNASIVDKRGFLVIDARSGNWIDTVREVIKGKSDDTLIPDESCISERMNIAWAWHELTGEFAEEMLDFCEEKGRFAKKSKKSASGAGGSKKR